MNSALALDEQQTRRGTAQRRGGLRWLVFTAGVPIGLLLIGSVVLGVREFRASAELQAKVSQLKQVGEPDDNASLDQWYRNRTHPAGAQAWAQILRFVMEACG